MSIPHSAASNRRLLSPSQNIYPTNPHEDYSQYGSLLRDPSTISTRDIGLPKVLEQDGEVGEQTLYQVDIVNDELERKSKRSQLATKDACLTRRWQTALAIGLVVLALAIAIGGLAYWITLPKVITQPYLLYGASCYMNSRSCDATRQLWCPAGTCICTGNYNWNATIQNCTCATYYQWTGTKCQSYGYYGDPCNSVPCRPTLICSAVVNQTYSTGQSICVCDNNTYLDAVSSSSTYRTCIPKITYNAVCQTNTDCQNWLGLACTYVSGVLRCQCGSTSYWNGTICKSNALGWQYCGGAVACDTTRGLTCDTSTNTCQCDSYSYWDNITTLYCQTKKTYAVSCAFDFQCNTTVNLSCPTSSSTGCNCPTTSTTNICDCASGNFWDGQRCVARHIFNGTCPGQYACSTNLVCYLGHCVCPGNMAWNNATANTCACLAGTTWNSVLNTCQ